MLVQCLRDNTKFEAREMPYPGEGRQRTENCAAGDKYIECPTCARRYFYYDATGKWTSDRDLKIL